MKSVSAAIIVLSGLAAFTVSAILQHSSMQEILAYLGGAVVVTGMAGWLWLTLADRSKTQRDQQ